MPQKVTWLSEAFLYSMRFLYVSYNTMMSIWKNHE